MSREIDARVAREVMGLEVESWDMELVGRVQKIVVADDILGDQRKNPPYSTDMNAAMEVVGRMRGLGWWMTFCNEPSGYSCEMWKDDVSPMIERSPIYADTPALAICLAALEAVESTG